MGTDVTRSDAGASRRSFAASENYAACEVKSQSIALAEITTALGAAPDYTHQRGDVWTVSAGGRTHFHRWTAWALREPISTPDAAQMAIDRILDRWPAVAARLTNLSSDVSATALEVKLDVRVDLGQPCRFSISPKQLSLCATTGFNISLYDTRDHPEIILSPRELATKRVGLRSTTGEWVLQHAALPECDTLTLVNTALLGASRWFVWDAHRVRAQWPATFFVGVPLHHDAHFDTGFSLDPDEVRLLVDLDVSFDVEISTLP